MDSNDKRFMVTNLEGKKQTNKPTQKETKERNSNAIPKANFFTCS